MPAGMNTLPSFSQLRVRHILMPVVVPSETTTILKFSNQKAAEGLYSVTLISHSYVWIRQFTDADRIDLPNRHRQWYRLNRAI